MTIDIEKLKERLLTPCGRTTGHGECCSVGWECRACAEKKQAADALSQLQAENERLKADAKRYRWLREGQAYTVECVNRNGKPVLYFVGDRHEAANWGDKLDAVIDAAMLTAAPNEQSPSQMLNAAGFTRRKGSGLTYGGYYLDETQPEN